MDNTDFRDYFVLNLIDYATLYGMTQNDIVEKTGIPKSTMSMYFSGKRFPRAKQLIAIADCLHTTPDTLLSKRQTEEERVGELPYELQQIVEGGKRLSPDQRTRLLNYCRSVYPDAFCL